MSQTTAGSKRRHSLACKQHSQACKPVRTRARRLAAAALAGLLAACNPVPNDGPLKFQVTSKHEMKDDFVYALVELDAHSVRTLERHDYRPLSEKFGLPRGRNATRLGVGDQLSVTIFEAGPDGIFSTQERKSVTIPLTVKQNGRISIPFDGEVRAAGRTVAQVRRAVLASLRGRAVEPDVIVELAELRSRAATVNGAVRSGAIVPLLLGRERVLDVIAAAGGPTREPYNTYISLSRGGDTRTALLQTLIRHPRENIFVRPDDSLYLTYEPRRFTALGAVKQDARFEFGSRDLTLMEALALAGSFEDVRANPQAVFIFRYEHEHVLRHLHEKHYVSHKLLWKVIEDHKLRDKHGRVPVVYRVDLSDADNFFIAKRMPIRADDTLYVSRKLSVDFGKVVQLLAQARVAATIIPSTATSLGAN